MSSFHLLCGLVTFRLPSIDGLFFSRFRDDRMKLRIYEVSVADAGVYVLEAANADMMTSESVTLAVTGKSQNQNHN